MKKSNADKLRKLNRTIESLTDEATRLTQRMRIARVQRDRLLRSIEHQYMEESGDRSQEAAKPQPQIPDPHFGKLPTPEQYFADFARELSDLELELLIRRLGDHQDSGVDSSALCPLATGHRPLMTARAS